jgi:uncharacterized protein Veg
MYIDIISKLKELRGKKVLAIIDEGRSRKKEEQCKIKGIYNRVFTIEIDNVLMSFSYSDLICKTIILKKM